MTTMMRFYGRFKYDHVLCLEAVSLVKKFLIKFSQLFDIIKAENMFLIRYSINFITKSQEIFPKKSVFIAKLAFRLFASSFLSIFIFT
jgi:hypothetical protein